MVKIINQFGDVKRGKQHTVVYQGHYGNQMRRMLKDKKDEHTRGQLEQRERFRVGIDFAKGLTKAQKDFIKLYMAEAGIRSPDGLPTTWYTFAKKIAMTRPKVEIETEAGEGFSGIYADWTYRKPITINNQSGGELTNYQVLITLTTDNIDYSHFNADGSDIRFTNNNVVALNYWIEDWNNGGTSKVWVKVDSIQTGENVCGYLFYGNASANDESNGDATFTFFDDFDGIPDYFVKKLDDFSESTAYLQGATCDGTHVYVTAAGGSYPGKLLKYTKTGSLVTSRTLSTVTDHVDHISDLTVVGDYLYVADFKDWYSDQPHSEAKGQIVKFNKSDLTYAGETHEVGNHWAESIKYWNNSWWVTFHCCSVIRKYNNNWDFVKEYDIAGHGGNEGEEANGNGYQGLSIWIQNSKTYFGLTVHNSVTGANRFYIFEYSAGSDTLSFVKYIAGNKGEFHTCQGWDVESGTDGSITWFADRVNAKIVKADVETCFDGAGFSLDTDKWEEDTNYASISNSILTFTGATASLTSKIDYPKPKILKTKCKISPVATSKYGYIGLLTYSPAARMCAIQSRTNEKKVSVLDGTYTSTIITDDITNWITYEVKWKNGEAKHYVNNVLKATHTTHVPTCDLPAGLYISPSGITVYSDWILIREYASTEPTNTVGTEQEGNQQSIIKSLKIHHPAIKSYEIYNAGVKEENLSDLENHISTVVTRTNLNLTASKIVVKTLANQEYEFIVK